MKNVEKIRRTEFDASLFKADLTIKEVEDGDGLRYSRHLSSR